jgi:hypothetical protein
MVEEAAAVVLVRVLTKLIRINETAGAIIAMIIHTDSFLFFSAASPFKITAVAILTASAPAAR